MLQRAWNWIVPTASFGSSGNQAASTQFVNSGLLGTSGIWTPILTLVTPGNMTVSYSTQSGNYFKIGSMVTASFSIVTSNFTVGTGSGDITIVGFPYASTTASGGIIRGPMVWGGVTLAAGYTYLAFTLNANSTSGTIRKCGSGTSVAQLTTGDYASGNTIDLRSTVVYPTAS